MTEPFTLLGRRIVLDAPTAADAPLVTEYCQDPDFHRYLSIPSPYRLSDAEYFLGTIAGGGWASGGEYTWAIRSPRRGFLGIISLRNDASDVGFWLGAPHRGRGFMPEALGVVLDWAFANGREQVGWECRVGNLASMAVARKLGFRYTGTGPARLAGRDGGHPESWKGVLAIGDERTPQPGWPQP
jgi:RimJ/RimL family protein N-acetyltransferase